MKRWKRFIMRIGFSGFQGFRLDRKGREVRALDEVHQFRRVVTRTQVVINLCHSSLKHWQDVVFAGILFLGFLYVLTGVPTRHDRSEVAAILDRLRTRTRSSVGGILSDISGVVVAGFAGCW